MTERTAWVTHDAEPGACTEPECDGFGRVSERQVSVPWCTEHDSKAANNYPACEAKWYLDVNGRDEHPLIWSEKCVIVDGVVWKVVTDD